MQSSTPTFRGPRFWLLALALYAMPALAQQNLESPNVASKIAGTSLSTNAASTPFTATGTFRPLGQWSVRIESMRVVRDTQIEVIATFKNIQRRKAILAKGFGDLVLTDADGVGFRNIGNLYRAGGDPDMEPELLKEEKELETGEQEKVLLLFDIPRGAVPLKTLTVFDGRAKPLTFDASGLELPETTSPVALPIRDAVGGSTHFDDLNEFLIRFDGVRRGRNNVWQVFLTVKNNAPNKQAWKSHPGYGLDVNVIDSRGAKRADEGNLYRASGEALDLAPIKNMIALIPDGQATVCYPVALSPDTVGTELQIKLASKTITFPLPVLH
jgi:hypothetical protein